MKKGCIERKEDILKKTTGGKRIKSIEERKIFERKENISKTGKNTQERLERRVQKDKVEKKACIERKENK